MEIKREDVTGLLQSICGMIPCKNTACPYIFSYPLLSFESSSNNSPNINAAIIKELPP